jgi:cysteine desulfurase/selenocysteine lyase
MSASIRKQFPILKRRIHGKPLLYLDSTATTQKPQVVIDAVSDFTKKHNANVHRGVYTLAEEASAMYEGMREKVRTYINAATVEEVIFTRNATEAINLVASTWGRVNVKRGDRILVTLMEHHSNIVPWQELAKEKGATVDFVPVKNDGRLDLAAFRKLLKRKPKLVGITMMSNVLGTVNPVRELTRLAHGAGATVLVDAAQAAARLPIDVQKIGCDFLVFSGHKVYGPTGIGVLYGKKELLATMPPYQFGGDMIRAVRTSGAEWNDLPWKFEAGTPNASGVIGLGAALDFIHSVGLRKIWTHEQKLTRLALRLLSRVPGVTVLGPKAAMNRGGVFAFTVRGVHPHDLATFLDAEGIAIRAGHHCAMPLHERFGIQATSRASFGIYTTEAEIRTFVSALKRIVAKYARG